MDGASLQQHTLTQKPFYTEQCDDADDDGNECNICRDPVISSLALIVIAVTSPHSLLLGRHNFAHLVGGSLRPGH